MDQILWFVKTFFPKTMIRDLIANLARHIVDNTETEADDKIVEIFIKMYDAYPEPEKLGPLVFDILEVVAEATPSEVDNLVIKALGAE